MRLKKDYRTTIRIDSRIYDMLRENGYSVQRIFDDAIERIIDIRVKTPKKKEKGEKDAA